MLLARAHASSGTSARVEMQRSNSPSLQGNEHRGKACPTNKECCFLVEPDSARIQMSLEGGAVNARLAALLGEPPKKPVDFAVPIDMSRGHGRSLAHHILMAVSDLDLSTVEFACGRHLRAVHHDRALIRCRTPTTTAKRWSGSTKRSRHGEIRRAIDYMQSHLHAPVTLADIVAASGIPGRTLLKHFKDWRGVSPMRHLRNVQLAHARQALLRASPDENVTEIAMSLGFTHMGRFSSDIAATLVKAPRRRS